MSATYPALYPCRSQSSSLSDVSAKPAMRAPFASSATASQDVPRAACRAPRRGGQEPGALIAHGPGCPGEDDLPSWAQPMPPDDEAPGAVAGAGGFVSRRMITCFRPQPRLHRLRQRPIQQRLLRQPQLRVRPQRQPHRLRQREQPLQQRPGSTPQQWSSTSSPWG
ncbi:MAG: hypothetical protein JWP90_1748 [Mycetocola sp.]|nr:hypothetical protein [Mycetocola sp.]